MASFPSRRMRGSFLSGVFQQRRKDRRRRGNAWAHALSPEPLERRSMMAVDSFDATMSTGTDTYVWSTSDSGSATESYVATDSPSTDSYTVTSFLDLSTTNDSTEGVSYGTSTEASGSDGTVDSLTTAASSGSTSANLVATALGGESAGGLSTFEEIDAQQRAEVSAAEMTRDDAIAAATIARDAVYRAADEAAQASGTAASVTATGKVTAADTALDVIVSDAQAVATRDAQAAQAVYDQALQDANQQYDAAFAAAQQARDARVATAQADRDATVAGAADAVATGLATAEAASVTAADAATVALTTTIDALSGSYASAVDAASQQRQAVLAAVTANHDVMVSVIEAEKLTAVTDSTATAASLKASLEAARSQAVTVATATYQSGPDDASVTAPFVFTASASTSATTFTNLETAFNDSLALQQAILVQQLSDVDAIMSAKAASADLDLVNSLAQAAAQKASALAAAEAAKTTAIENATAAAASQKADIQATYAQTLQSAADGFDAAIAPLVSQHDAAVQAARQAMVNATTAADHNLRLTRGAADQALAAVNQSLDQEVQRRQEQLTQALLPSERPAEDTSIAAFRVEKQGERDAAIAQAQVVCSAALSTSVETYQQALDEVSAAYNADYWVAQQRFSAAIAGLDADDNNRTNAAYSEPLPEMDLLVMAAVSRMAAQQALDQAMVYDNLYVYEYDENGQLTYFGKQPLPPGILTVDEAQAALNAADAAFMARDAEWMDAVMVKLAHVHEDTAKRAEESHVTFVTAVGDAGITVARKTGQALSQLSTSTAAAVKAFADARTSAQTACSIAIVNRLHEVAIEQLNKDVAFSTQAAENRKTLRTEFAEFLQATANTRAAAQRTWSETVAAADAAHTTAVADATATLNVALAQADLSLTTGTEQALDLYVYRATEASVAAAEGLATAEGNLQVAIAQANANVAAAEAAAEGAASKAETAAQGVHATKMAELGVESAARVTAVLQAFSLGVSEVVGDYLSQFAAAAKGAANAAAADATGQASAWSQSQGTRYAEYISGVVAANAASWAGSVIADVDAAVAKTSAEIDAWGTTLSLDALLGIQTAVLDQLYTTAVVTAANTFADGYATALTTVAADLGTAATGYVRTVMTLAHDEVVTTARADATLEVVTQSADGFYAKAVAGAFADAQEQFGQAGKTAAAALAAVSRDAVTTVASAVETYAITVSAAQAELDTSNAAIEFDRTISRIDASADYHRAVWAAQTSCEINLAGLDVTFGAMRSALAAQKAGAAADASAADTLRSAENAKVEAIQRVQQSWEARIQELEQAAALKQWSWSDLGTTLAQVAGGFVEMVGGVTLATASGVATVLSSGTITPFSVATAAFGLGMIGHGFDTAWTALSNAINGTNDRTGAQQALDRLTGSETASNWIDFGISLAAGGVAGRAAQAMNMVDDAGQCANFLTRLNLGLCFTGDTLVQVTALAGDPYEISTCETAYTLAGAGDGGTATLLDTSLPLATHPGLRALPITDVPLGARVLAGNPRTEEFDAAFPEPDQTTWVTLSLDLVKRDGTPVRAEFLRPSEWVERNGIVAGASLPIAISELEIEGDAFVTAINPCPPVAEGPGRVVTGRFVTRDAGNLVRITLDNNTEIRATDVHPIWSVDREEWIPAGELVPGELVDTLAGPVAVETVERLHSGLDVYNIEVHGEHVFRVTADGVLVHNAYAPARLAAIEHWGESFMQGRQAAHIIPKQGWPWAPESLHAIISKVTDAGLIDDIHVNIFAAEAGHAGTHTAAYVDDVIAVMKNRTSREAMIEGIELLWRRIKTGGYD